MFGHRLWRDRKGTEFAFFRGTVAACSRLIETVVVLLIRFYQCFLSVLLGPCCRFFPSCSTYAIESIERFGLGKGSLLAVKRFVKCHPFHSGGFDPVPGTGSDIQGP